MDTVGNRHARLEIAAIKVAGPQVALKIIDRAIQIHGGGGVSDDFPLAAMWAHQRTLRLADGPDEVHKRTIAQRELRRWQAPVGESATNGMAAGAPVPAG
jgi:acyl-CoA dehydrogenase